jgi:hypothetical protein
LRDTLDWSDFFLFDYKEIGESLLQLYMAEPKPARISLIGFGALRDIFGGLILGTFLRKTQFFRKNMVFWGKLIYRCVAQITTFTTTP